MGQSSRHKKNLGNAYGVPRDFSRMPKNELQQEFVSCLPRSLGVPHFINTVQSPLIFAAFYDAQDHELSSGAIHYGVKFRIWDTSINATKPRILAGIIGFHSNFHAKIGITALSDCGTSAKDIEPYGRTIMEMFAELNLPAK